MMGKRIPIVCLDFDGVLHSYASGWKGARNIPDPPVEGAIQWLLDLVYTVPDNICAMAPPPDIQVCVYSSRSKYWGGRKAMMNWLIKHGVDYGFFRDKLITFPKYKPPATITVDDRAFCFKGEFPKREDLKNFKSWIRKEANE